MYIKFEKIVPSQIGENGNYHFRFQWGFETPKFAQMLKEHYVLKLLLL